MELLARVTGGLHVADDKELGPVRTEELDPDLAAQIEAAIRDVRFFELRDRYTAKGADIPAHTLRVKDSAQERTVAWDRIAEFPEQLEAIVGLLEKSGHEWHQFSYRPA